MKTRLLVAAVFILALPMWFSNSDSENFNSSAPFTTVAIAGHTIVGGYCSPCETGGCICDPGEPSSQSARPVPDASTVQGKLKAKPVRRFDLDFGTGAFLIGLALFMWSRFRA